MGGGDRAYVNGMRVPPVQGTSIGETGAAAASRFSPLLVAATLVGVLSLAATLALWTYYGTAVFYEMIVAGLAACL